MSQIAYHRFQNLTHYSAFEGVTPPHNLIIAYAVLFVLPKPANKPTCGIFTTKEVKTYQVGEACALPGAKDSKTPLEIPELAGKEVNHFCLSQRHAAMLMDDGSVYSWGANDYGQLGHGDETPLSRPKKVSGDVPFTKIHCAANATIGLARGGDVFQWGLLNPKSTEKYNSPHKCGVNGEFLAVSAHHAGAYKANKLWTWGLGADGRLGHNNTNDISCDKPEKIPTAVEDVAMGARSTAVIDETGRVRVFGKNYGNLKPKYGPAILTPLPVKRLVEAEVLAASWTDDFYLVNLEDKSQMIFGDQVAIDDPDADKEGPEVSKGAPPKRQKVPMKF